MSIDNATVRRIATLARIEVTDAELSTWAGQLNGIMGWIEQLKEVNTDGVAPMSGGTDLKLTLRADQVTDGGIVDQVLMNATEPQDGYFTVPKVVE
ncbi:MAG: Asp-tRNA(Asn)/Glu-tRNA(Gln) amidotransferase subunit GatC [Rhodospirillaceae bacterium]|nr:Asp-tRNA(Asn)/Glu-tRNA(Gln) amidotransferase subunit GatC [Rhodospirillaceae bacterium]